jgi:hypothetical protein
VQIAREGGFRLVSNFSSRGAANGRLCARSILNVNTNNQTMRHYLRLLLWVAVALVLSFATARADTRAATLEAIHQLENPRNLTRPGSRGELGAYQFRAQTWRMHTVAPFAHALDRSVSDAVAVKHYEWLRVSLERAGKPATPYAIGLAWNGGLEAVLRGNSPRAARDYAQRVANLAEALEREKSAVAAK